MTVSLSTIVLLTRHLYRRGPGAVDGRCELVWLGRQDVSVEEKRRWVEIKQASVGIVYMSIPISQFIPLSFPPLYPYVCSLHLCLYFYFVNKIISTNFFRLYIYALTYDICFSLYETSLCMTVSRSIYVSINDPVQFLMIEQYSIIHIYIHTISLSSVDGHAGCV